MRFYANKRIQTNLRLLKISTDYKIMYNLNIANFFVLDHFN